MDKSKWVYKKCSDVFDIFMGRTPSRKDLSFWENGSHLWVSISDMTSKYIVTTKEHINDKAIKNIRIVPENTVLMSFKLTIGRTAITKKPLFTNEAIMAFPIKSGFQIDPNFLYYYLPNVKWARNSNRAVMGSTLNKKSISDTIIAIPPLSIQLQIVSELDQLNELISLKQQQLKEYDALAQSIFYEMFGNEKNNYKGFPIYKLSDLFKIGTGSTPSRKLKNEYYYGDFCWVKTTEVHGEPIYDTEEKITQRALNDTNCKLYPSDTILIAMYGQGKTRGQVGRLMIPAATNQACAAILPDPETCNIDFVFEFIKMSYDRIRNMARGGTQSNLNLSLVKSIQIPLPPLTLQQSFAERVRAIEQQKALEKQSIAEVQTLLDSRMQEYFG